MKKAINLSVISYHACPLASSEGKETGGLNVYVLETAIRLGKLGYKIDIFTRSHDSKQPHKIQISKNVRLLHIVAGPEKPLNKQLLLPFLDIFSQSLVNFAKKENLKYDIVHCHYYLSGLVGIKLKEIFKAPLITTFHTLAHLKNLVSREGFEKENNFRLASEQKLVRKSDFIVGTSDNDAAYINYLYNCPKEKLSVVTPGVDGKIFKPLNKKTSLEKIGAANDEKVILAVGRIEPLKGFDSLLYAIKILLTKNQDLQKHISLQIIGGDTSEPKRFWSKELKHLLMLRHKLGIKAMVKFVGQQKQVALPYYYNASEVLVMPSHYESFGMVALESLACGIPVIISNSSGISAEIKTNSSIKLLTANNPLLLADLLWHFLSRKNNLIRKNRLAGKINKSFSWEKSARKMDQIYTSVSLSLQGILQN